MSKTGVKGWGVQKSRGGVFVGKVYGVMGRSWCGRLLNRLVRAKEKGIPTGITVAVIVAINSYIAEQGNGIVRSGIRRHLALALVGGLLVVAWWV